MWFWKKIVKIDDPEILKLMNIYLDRVPELRKELDSTSIYSKRYESIEASFLTKRYGALFKIYKKSPDSLEYATVDIDKIKSDLVFEWKEACFPKKNSGLDSIQLLVTIFSMMLKKQSKTVMSWLEKESVQNTIFHRTSPNETFTYVLKRSISSAHRMLWVLCEIGDTSISEHAAKWIINHGGVLSSNSMSSSKIFECVTDSIRGIIPMSSMQKIFGAYTDIILEITHYRYIKGGGGSILSEGASYDLSKPYEAVSKLSEINSPISNNILHLAAQRKDIFLGAYSHSYDSYMTTTNRNSIDYKNISKLASAILIERGNSKYKSQYWKEIYN